MRTIRSRSRAWMIAGALLLPLTLSAPVLSTKHPPETYIVTLAVGTDGDACSAFSVNPNGTYFTAAHCLHTSATLDGKTVDTLLIDDQTDLGVFRAKGRPGLLLGKAPKVGDLVFLLGFGDIKNVLLQWQGVVFGLTIVPAEGIAPVLLVGVGASPGMSGGPILNKDGKVVSLVSGTGDVTGPLRNLTGGVPYFALEQAWRRYGVQEY